MGLLSSKCVGAEINRHPAEGSEHDINITKCMEKSAGHFGPYVHHIEICVPPGGLFLRNWYGLEPKWIPSMPVSKSTLRQVLCRVLGYFG